MSITDVIDAQLAAYNARNIEDLLATYHEDCVIEDAVGNIQNSGKEEIRERYTALFEISPELNATITNRIVHNNYVIDHESVTGHRGRTDILLAVPVYRVENGLITHVRFIG
ncbi:nuclear transport factor 2 family protein [Paenibacillus shunpengii]|uniref:Nuclear transport factor 2 family protein n=1 Tax=Paenibacillus shunpengii TaxID=2054424 RepID=A0ABW5SHR5_9BACL|nr:MULTISPECIES: nuclear transport factor 2 family protein [unclassified Paenibacillus]OMC72239.1 hypothetical protein BK126_09640 [Paenibacillus sp. FSL H7-0326]SDX44380.1 conserved hypothetical protein [Paenibacillus sp. PDC88]